MAEYNREELITLSNELYKCAKIYADYSYSLDIKDENLKNEFRSLSDKLFFKSTEVSRIVTANDVAEINNLTKKIQDFDADIKEEIKRLEKLGIKIQEIGATVGIIAEIAQIAAKLSKFAA